MRKCNQFCTSLCAVLFFLIGPVRAQSILWVANNGSDANICSQTAPCATFQGAINKGNVAQVNCLTSGSYGAFTITASITIDCGTGNVGNVVVSSPSGHGITLNASSAANIVLRHLVLNGNGTSGYGILTQSFFSGTLIVEDCTIHGFHSSYGIDFEPSFGRGLLQVSNSQIFDNLDGIVVNPLSGIIATVSLDRVELTANLQIGLYLGGSGGIVAGSMHDSIAGANGTSGVFSAASQVFFTVDKSSIVDNLAFGVVTNSAGSVVNVGGSTIGGNGTGVAALAGALISFGTNQISANGSNGNFTSTTTLH